MKIALQFEMQRPTLGDHLVLEETMEQCILADQAGFDCVWLVEHHFLTGFSASPCPDIVWAALSQRTERIRLGLGVVILPYHHPARVAERVATLDHLSSGRVEFGTGRSAAYELEGMGIDPRDSRDMWDESLTMVPKIWESDWFEWEGRFWSVPSRQILPKPYQKPHPPIWVAALQPATYQIAAEKGIGVLALGAGSPDGLTPHIQAYHEKVRTANPVGTFVNDQWASQTFGICMEDNNKAQEMGAQSIKTFFGPERPYTQNQKHVYERLLEQWGGVPDHLRANFARYLDPAGGKALTLEEALDLSGVAAAAQKAWNDIDPETLCNRAVIIAGNPESCVEGIRKHEAAGVDQIIIMMQTETFDHPTLMRSIELFGKHVIPEFKKSEAAVT